MLRASRGKKYSVGEGVGRRELWQCECYESVEGSSTVWVRVGRRELWQCECYEPVEGSSTVWVRESVEGSCGSVSVTSQ